MAMEKQRQMIREACNKKRWSVMDLARASHVSAEAIRRFVSGRGEVSTRVMLRLMKALEIEKI